MPPPVMHGLPQGNSPQYLTLSAHGVILYILFKLEFDLGIDGTWPYGLLAMSIVGALGWVANDRRYRQVHDLPTSRVASAAQGYVELVGRGELLGDKPLLSRLSGVPCCWHHYLIEEWGLDGKLRTMAEGSSIEHFLLVDETGQCVIAPDGAEIVTSKHRRWTAGKQIYTEWLLTPHEVIYALGEFSTDSQHLGDAAAERVEVTALLANWKEDKAALHQRFDLNQDGTINRKEWELARLQAQREVRRQRGRPAQAPIEGVHQLHQPQDGRLFLLANEIPALLGKHYYSWSLLHLATLIGAGVGGLIGLYLK